MWIARWPLVFAFAALASAAPVGKSHYGIVFDAGSSGTRIHVYTWRTGGGGPKDAFDLVSDELLKIKPGLSAYKDRPSEAGASLEPLLAFARSKIPAELIASTPMFLMATAGLRLVGEATKDAILASVCGYLGSTGFLFRCEWATLLDGRDEGLYGWVTVNYLLDALYPGGAQPAGTIDLGGGSVQIVFPTPAVAPSSAPAELSQRLDFGGRSHALHVTHKGSVVQGAGDYRRCKKLTKRLFGVEACSYGEGIPTPRPPGVYQPPLPKRFYGRLAHARPDRQVPTASLYTTELRTGFSYMFDRTAAIGLLDQKPVTFGAAEMSRDDIERAAKAVCSLDQAGAAARFAATNDAAKAANFCGDTVYIAALLDALGFDERSTMTMTNKIKDVELVWTLGAMLAQSSALASGASGSHFGALSWLALAATLAGLWYFCLGPGSRPSGPPRLYNRPPP
ncbi:hypothetical protein EMIHUDRAFT_235054 [Emiliania huxleyi CCMP1516]|uniref:Apyrase n=2 Tax=Emiliania huxleyi TaxID=2903 RepID=A0A0D3JX96_EMIH1|nr:hypothetical protein EMIHUDRAFT_235054 [Emiliania huxleyi CCMP1516]EOD28131.1 hypothetical protein EMIHUDRAFT_235054 [Emiliania huxleyi CCMP1516]|eukprot:XP_005780560.1 hypothetical protein EMIHUDRAFT_235054 [Emiliania huxleyi CCMP1516]